MTNTGSSLSVKCTDAFTVAGCRHYRSASPPGIASCAIVSFRATYGYTAYSRNELLQVRPEVLPPPLYIADGLRCFDSPTNVTVIDLLLLMLFRDGVL